MFYSSLQRVSSADRKRIINTRPQKDKRQAGKESAEKKRRIMILKQGGLSKGLLSIK